MPNDQSETVPTTLEGCKAALRDVRIRLGRTDDSDDYFEGMTFERCQQWLAYAIAEEKTYYKRLCNVLYYSVAIVFGLLVLTALTYVPLPPQRLVWLRNELRPLSATMAGLVGLEALFAYLNLRAYRAPSERVRKQTHTIKFVLTVLVSIAGAVLGAIVLTALITFFAIPWPAGDATFLAILAIVLFIMVLISAATFAYQRYVNGIADPQQAWQNAGRSVVEPFSLFLFIAIKSLSLYFFTYLAALALGVDTFFVAHLGVVAAIIGATIIIATGASYLRNRRKSGEWESRYSSFEGAVLLGGTYLFLSAGGIALVALGVTTALRHLGFIL